MGYEMDGRSALFRKRQFAGEIIVTCVRWYLRFSLSLRDVEELMAERGLSVDHTSVWRWTQRYAPEVERRLRGQLKPKGSTWHIDETFVRISSRWMYLFRAVDSAGQTVDFYLSETRDREAAKCFLKRALWAGCDFEESGTGRCESTLQTRLQIPKRADLASGRQLLKQLHFLITETTVGLTRELGGKQTPKELQSRYCV
jgi:hypothetical protein